MALSVDTKKISEEVKDFDGYVKRYEDNNADFFYELGKLDNYFLDENINLVRDRAIKDKNSNSQVLDALREVSNFYKQVINIYDKYRGE